MEKELLCEAFCNEIDIRRVPSGFAVRTQFEGLSGDAIGFYIIPPSVKGGTYRIEDDGANVAFLEAAGVDLRSGQRAAIFKSLLNEYGLRFDKETREIHTPALAESELPRASLRFVAMLLRLQDLGLLHPKTVEATFIEDAQKAIEKRFSEVADIRYGDVLTQRLRNYPIDVVLRPPGRAPVAIYYGTSDSRINEAVLLWMETHFTLREACAVILLMERAHPRGITERVLARALNYLDAVTVFRDEEESALQRIANFVEGRSSSYIQ